MYPPNLNFPANLITGDRPAYRPFASREGGVVLGDYSCPKRRFTPRAGSRFEEISVTTALGQPTVLTRSIDLKKEPEEVFALLARRPGCFFLDSALAGHEPGDSVTVTWLDPSGAQHSAAVTLAQGPAA